MKKPLIATFFLTLAVLFISCSKPTDTSTSAPNTTNNVNFSTIEWVSTSLIYSSSTAKKSLSVLYFTDDVCADGELMEQNTFVDSAVIATLNNSYNIARVSTANDSLIHFNDTLMTGNQLFKLYNLVGVPSLLILDDENRYFGRIQANYYPSGEFLQLLEFYQNKQ